MKKYIIKYEDYNNILALLGHGVPHSNLEHVSTVIVDLTEEEYEGLVGAGIDIKENEYKTKLLYLPPNVSFRSYPTDPPDINSYARIPQSHAAGFDGTGVNVALLGSGCQDSNAALCGPTLTRLDFTGLGVGDDYSHESKGCCIGLQRYSFFSPGLEVKNGMAYGCNLYSMRTLEGGNAAVINAINYCIANNIHIINCSFDTGTGTGLESAVQAAMDAGIIFVCASGNTIGSPVAHPANIPGVICINSTQYDNAGIPFGSYITSDGHIQVTATLYNGGHYEFWAGGTSQAAWMTSFILAIYKQKYPSLNTERAANILRRRALALDAYDPTISSPSRGKLANYQTGAGFIAPIN